MVTRLYYAELMRRDSRESTARYDSSTLNAAAKKLTGGGEPAVFHCVSPPSWCGAGRDGREWRRLWAACAVQWLICAGVVLRWLATRMHECARCGDSVVMRIISDAAYLVDISTRQLLSLQCPVRVVSCVAFGICLIFDTKCGVYFTVILIRGSICVLGVYKSECSVPSVR